MSRVLVTGAAGFIGSHVVRALVAEGRQVRALLAPGEQALNLRGLPVEAVVGDVTVPAQVEAAMDGCGRIFHLAALYTLWSPDPQLIYRVNVEGTRTVMACAHRRGVERVVYTSSIAAVGVNPDGPADEDHVFNDFALGMPYVLSKHLAEQEVLRWAARGLPVVVVNPAFPFGRGDVRPTPTGQIIADVLEGRLPGYTDGGLCAVDVQDVARGHLLAERVGVVGRRYILGGTNLSYREFIARVCVRAGVPVVERHLPVGLTLAAAWGYHLARPLLGRGAVLTPDAVRYSARALYYDTTRAQRELGYTVTPLEETLDTCIDWFRREWPGRKA